MIREFENIKKIKYLSSEKNQDVNPSVDWMPKMAPYMRFKNNAYQFRPKLASKLLKLAGSVLINKLKSKNCILFVDTKTSSQTDVSKLGNRKNIFYINHKWPGGVLTNWETTKSRTKSIENLELEINSLKAGDKNYKLKLRKKKHLEKLKKLYSGLLGIPTRPELVIFFSHEKEINGIKECLKLGISAICIANSSSDPSAFPYIILCGEQDCAKTEIISQYFYTKLYKFLNNSGI